MASINEYPRTPAPSALLTDNQLRRINSVRNYLSTELQWISGASPKIVNEWIRLCAYRLIHNGPVLINIWIDDDNQEPKIFHMT